VFSLFFEPAEWANLAHKKTGVQPGLLVIGSGFIVAAFVLVTFGQDYFTKAACFFPPAVMTIAQMKSGSIDGPFWITYWLVFNWFTVCESITTYLAEWIPFYHWLKMMFLYWCFHSKTKGATIIWENFLLKLDQPSEELPPTVEEHDPGYAPGEYLPDEQPDDAELLQESEAAEI